MINLKKVLEGKQRSKIERIVESPVVPQVPSGTSKKLNVMIACCILGLFVGVFAAFFKNLYGEFLR